MTAIRAKRLAIRRAGGRAYAVVRQLLFRLTAGRAVAVAQEWVLPPPDCTGREVCVFVSYSPDGRIAPYAAFHAQAWRRAGFVVVLVVNLEDPAGFAADQPHDYADAILLRRNRGYDFGAWAAAITSLPGLREAARLVTVNDSIFGPLDGFEAFVERLRGTPADVVGAVESLEHARHFQSFLLAFGPAALRHEAFWRFWRGIRVGGRQEVIAAYELRLVARLTAAGLSAAAILPAPAGDRRNPTLLRWRELIEAGLPFVKAQLLRDNPGGANLTGWRDVIAARGYDPALIDRQLRRS